MTTEDEASELIRILVQHVQQFIPQDVSILVVMAQPQGQWAALLSNAPLEASLPARDAFMAGLANPQLVLQIILQEQQEDAPTNPDSDDTTLN